MKNKLHMALVLLGAIHFATLNAFAASSDCSKEDHYPEIQLNDLVEKIHSHSAIVFDVNSQESFDKDHVTGAIHYGSHKADFDKMLPEKKDAMIVAYCGGPKCGAWKEAAERACKKGYTHIYHYKDGIKGWIKATQKS